MSRATFNTELRWHDSRGSEIEASVRVLYSFTRGYLATLEEPGEEPSYEIITITPADSLVTIPDHFYTDAELIAECAEHWSGEEEAAAEWRAQAHRDSLLMGDDF